jgi:hypothetical protein
MKGAAILFFQYGKIEIDYLKNTGADTGPIVRSQACTFGQLPREQSKE